MSEESKNKEALEILLGTLKENPDLWETRKKTAKLLYEDKKYLEAADILWGAPEIPATDVDVAFALQVISRVKPNRSIRLIYEVLKRNHGKPLKNMAVAKALNNVGLYMEAARFYGAAIADDTKLFNLAFERQMLWIDDSQRLIEEWKDSDQEAKMPLDVPEQDLSGGMLRPAGIHQDIDAIVQGTENPAGAHQPGAVPAGPVTTQALVASSVSSPTQGGESTTSNAGALQPSPMVNPAAAKPNPLVTGNSGSPTQPLVTPKVAVKPNPLMTPGAEGAPVRSPLNAGVQTQPLAVGNVASPAGETPAAGPTSRPLLIAGADNQAPEPPGTNPLTPPNALPSSTGASATRPLMAAVPPQGATPTNPLATPGATGQKTNMLIPGNEAGGVPPNPQEAVSAQGASLAAEKVNAPLSDVNDQGAVQGMNPSPAMATPPMLRRPPTMVSSQPLQSSMAGVAQPGAAGMPMQTQPMMPMQTQPMMPMQTQPMMPVGAGMPMPTQGMMPMAMPGMPTMAPGMMPMAMPGMPMATQPLVPGQVPGMPIQPGMMQPVPGMPMATQPLMPGQVPGMPVQEPPPAGPKRAGFGSGPGAGLKFK